MRHFRHFSLFMLLTINLFAQHGTLKIGTNLAGPADWGTEWPFVDIMKYSREWITFNSVWVEDGENPWDTGVLDKISLDENGYPTELPVHVAGTETTQVVRTVWANTQSLKEGVYTVLYDGRGRIEIDFDGTVITDAPGRITFQLTRHDNILSLSILESDKTDPVRNIHVLLPGTESTCQADPWCAEWLEKLEPFGTLRFMDWGLTNNSVLKHWEDRPHIDDYTYTTRGVPYEWMIEICNFKQADCWICIPHEADSTYIREMARLFRDRLDPSLKIHVEYSNEIWNWMFDQTHYLLNNGDQNVEWPERIVPFIQNAMDIWSEEFAGQINRLVRVVGVQAAWQDVSNRVVFNMQTGSFDAFAPAAYFGFSEAGYTALEQLGGNASAEDVLVRAREAMLTDSWIWIKTQNEEISRKLGLPMIYYEGGQHLTPNPFGTVQPYGQALMDAQIHPGMYDLYSEWFDSLRTLIPEDKSALLMNFSFISSRDGQYGSWGVLEDQFSQFPPYNETAPKYQAILDAMSGSSVAGSAHSLPDGFRLYPVFPNPFNDSMVVLFDLKRQDDVEITVHDIRGGKIMTLLKKNLGPGRHSVRLNAAGTPSGMVLVSLRIQGNTALQKGLLLR